VLTDSRPPRFGRFKILAQALIQWARAGLQIAHHRILQHPVAAGVDDRFMERLIALARHLTGTGSLFHLAQSSAYGLQLAAIGMFGRQGGHFRLDQQACAHDFERSPFGGAIDLGAWRRARPGLDIDARARAHLNHPFDFQRNQGLTHRRPAHAELGGEVALGGQSRTQGELTLRDQLAQLIRNLAIEALRLDGLQGHGRTVSGITRIGQVVRPVTE